MQCSTLFVCRSVVVTHLVVAVVACSDNNSPTTPVLPTAYQETKLVADVASLGASTVDPNLVNAWGLAFSSANFLYATNFKKKSVDVFDKTFKYVSSFTESARQRR